MVGLCDNVANVGPVALALAGGRIVVLSHLRLAAGVCVLAAGLLMGAGGVVAVADPGSSGSAAHGDDGTNTSGQQHAAGAKKPKDERGGTDTNDGSLGSGGQSGQQHSAGAKKPKDEPVGADTQDEEKGSGVTGTVPNVVVAPVTDVVAAPVTNLVAPSDCSCVSVLAQLPSDLFSFLLGIAGAPPVVGGVAGIHGPGLSTPAGASGASRLPLVLPFAGVSGVPVAGNATRVATLDVIALGRVSALSGMAPQTPNGAFPVGAESSFPHVFREPPLIASVWALAAVALPGIGGLVILTAAGVRVQYGRLTPDSHREHRALPDSHIPRAVKRWMSAR